MTLRSTLLLLPVLLMAACSDIPDGIVPPQKMAQYHADMALAEAVVGRDRDRFQTDSQRLALRQSVEMRLGLTRAQVDTSLAWYAHHADRYTPVLDRALEIIDNRIDEARQAGATSRSRQAALGTRVTVDADSVNLWPGLQYRRLTPSDAMQAVTFDISRDRYWEKGDIYEFRVKTIPGSDVTIAFAADYTDGDTDYTDVTTRATGTGWVTARLALDSLKTASQVYGTLLVTPPAEGAPVYLDSLSLIRMHWKASRRRPTPAQRRLPVR